MSHLNRKTSVLAGAALVAAAWATPSQASPLATLTLQGKITGSGDAFSTTVAVNSAGGQSIDYQVVIDMAPTGTTNSNGSRTITALAVGTDGVNATKIDIFELATDAVQVNFAAAGVLNSDPSPVAGDAWNGGTGAGGGTPTARPAGVGNDLIAIRPVHSAGVFTAVDPEVMMSGTFVTAAGSGDSLVRMRFSTTSPSGSMKINGGTVSILPSAATENGADPLFGYTPLTLSVPEPTSLSLLGMGALGLLARRRK